MNKKTTSSRTRRRRNQLGQGLTEYITIVALVAVGAIAVIGLFGSDIKNAFMRSGNALEGRSVGPTQQTYDIAAVDFSDFYSPAPIDRGGLGFDDVVSVGVENTPVLGGIKTGVELVTGQNPITGDEIDRVDVGVGLIPGSDTVRGGIGIATGSDPITGEAVSPLDGVTDIILDNLPEE